MDYLLGYLIGYGFLFAVILGVGALYKKIGFSSELARKLIHILIQLDLERMVRKIVDLIQGDLMDSWQLCFRSACIIHE